MSTLQKFEITLAGGRRSHGEKTLEVRDPGAKSETIATVNTVDEEDVRHALDAAATAFPIWAATAPEIREAKLMKVADLLDQRAEEIARWITLENGKPLAESRTEVGVASDHFRWFAAEVRKIYGRVVPHSAAEKRHFVLKAPIGVVGAISPWNFPLSLSARKVAPALAAGCPVILKPASATPICALLMAECIREAGIDDRTCQVVVGNAGMIAKAFVDHPACRKITFTGSTEVGVKLAEAAARTMTKLSLELGGNAPLLVFADADLDLAVEEALKAKFRNTGQSCIAANRFLIEETIYDRFAEMFVARVRKLKVGHGLEAGVDIGALINQDAMDHAQETVRSSVAAGAKLLCGGEPDKDAKGYFFPATVLGDVPANAPCLGYEVFAPITPMMKFSTEEEAIRLANDTPFGLSAYLFTSNSSRGWRVAEALEAGTVGLNDGIPTVSHCPFGGYKSSGLGRELGSEGLEAFLETKHVSMRLA